MFCLVVGTSPTWEKAFERLMCAHRFQVMKVPFEDLGTINFNKSDYLFARYNEQYRVSNVFHSKIAAKVKGIFPSTNVLEYYDDKLRQFEKILIPQHVPIPKTCIIRNQHDLDICSLPYPCVYKKPKGSASINVKMVYSPWEVDSPCILQEFCPGNDRDYRVVCIGHRVFGLQRFNRKGDFRASGSGLVESTEILPLAKELCEFCSRNGFEVMAFDVLRDGSGNWVVTEMSYTFPITLNQGMETKEIKDIYGYYIDMKTGEKVFGEVDEAKLIFEDFLSRNRVVGTMTLW